MSSLLPLQSGITLVWASESHPKHRHKASRAKRVRIGFMLCSGALDPSGSHQSLANSSNLLTSAALIDKPTAGPSFASGSLSKYSKRSRKTCHIFEAPSTVFSAFPCFIAHLLCSPLLAARECTVLEKPLIDTNDVCSLSDIMH